MSSGRCVRRGFIGEDWTGSHDRGAVFGPSAAALLVSFSAVPGTADVHHDASYGYSQACVEETRYEEGLSDFFRGVWLFVTHKQE